jgi:hypothetical protein
VCYGPYSLLSIPSRNTMILRRQFLAHILGGARDSEGDKKFLRRNSMAFRKKLTVQYEVFYSALASTQLVGSDSFLVLLQLYTFLITDEMAGAVLSSNRSLQACAVVSIFLLGQWGVMGSVDLFVLFNIRTRHLTDPSNHLWKWARPSEIEAS